MLYTKLYKPIISYLRYKSNLFPIKNLKFSFAHAKTLYH